MYSEETASRYLNFGQIFLLLFVAIILLSVFVPFSSQVASFFGDDGTVLIPFFVGIFCAGNALATCWVKRSAKITILSSGVYVILTFIWGALFGRGEFVQITLLSFGIILISVSYLGAELFLWWQKRRRGRKTGAGYEKVLKT